MNLYNCDRHVGARLVMLGLICAVLAGSSGAARAAPEYLPEPICFKIINSAPYGILGEIATDEDEQADGTVVTHTASFRLGVGEEEPVCTTGPLFPGNKMRLKLRSLFPIFECKTMIYPGMELRIIGKYKKDGIGTETWAECR